MTFDEIDHIRNLDFRVRADGRMRCVYLTIFHAGHEFTRAISFVVIADNFRAGWHELIDDFFDQFNRAWMNLEPPRA